MNRLLTNLALRLGSPTGHAILIALALLLIAPMARAMQILVIDSTECVYCMAFKQSAGKTFAESSHAEWAELVHVDYAVKYVPVRSRWPDWFKQAVDEGRIGAVKNYPTFIFYDTLPGRITPREVMRIKGFGGPTWWYDRVEFFRQSYEEWLKSPPPSP